MKLSKYIDHTQLKADATKSDIIKLCEEAKQLKPKLPMGLAWENKAK